MRSLIRRKRHCNGVINGDFTLDVCGDCLAPDDPLRGLRCRDCDHAVWTATWTDDEDIDHTFLLTPIPLSGSPADFYAYDIPGGFRRSSNALPPIGIEDQQRILFVQDPSGAVSLLMINNAACNATSGEDGNVIPPGVDNGGFLRERIMLPSPGVFPTTWVDVVLDDRNIDPFHGYDPQDEYDAPTGSLFWHWPDCYTDGVVLSIIPAFDGACFTLRTTEACGIFGHVLSSWNNTYFVNESVPLFADIRFCAHCAAPCTLLAGSTLLTVADTAETVIRLGTNLTIPSPPTGLFPDEDPNLFTNLTADIFLIGCPLTTLPPGDLDPTALIIDRLDDVVFNAVFPFGPRTSRVQVLDIHLCSTTPLVLPSTTWSVDVGLSWHVVAQPITNITFFADNASCACDQGGRVDGLIVVVPRLTFTQLTGPHVGSQVVWDFGLYNISLVFALVDAHWTGNAFANPPAGFLTILGGTVIVLPPVSTAVMLAENNTVPLAPFVLPPTTNVWIGNSALCFGIACDPTVAGRVFRLRNGTADNFDAQLLVYPTLTNETDTDGDGIPDLVDNCVSIPNADQLDSDCDGVGDVCDSCPDTFNPCQDTTLDRCGQCLSLDDPLFNDCVDCANVPFGGFVFDSCHVCLAPDDPNFDTSCAPCDTPLFTATWDSGSEKTLNPIRLDLTGQTVEQWYAYNTANPTSSNTMNPSIELNNLAVLAFTKDVNGTLALVFTLSKTGGDASTGHIAFTSDYAGASILVANDDNTLLPSSGDFPDDLNFNGVTGAADLEWAWQEGRNDGVVIGPLPMEPNKCITITLVDLECIFPTTLALASAGPNGTVTYTYINVAEDGPVTICSRCEGPCIVLPGVDLYTTPMNLETFMVFGSTSVPAIPANFFFPGSLPFTGTVFLTNCGPDTTLSTLPGGPAALDFSDAVIDRQAQANLTGAGLSATIPAELLALTLCSSQPILVGTRLWNVTMCADDAASLIGSMTITASECGCDRGTFDAALPWRPRFTFVRADGTGSPKVLTWSGTPGFNPSSSFLTLILTDIPWLRTALPGVIVPVIPTGTVTLDADCNPSPAINPGPILRGSSGDFFPGMSQVDCNGTCPTVNTTDRNLDRVLFGHSGDAFFWETYLTQLNTASDVDHDGVPDVVDNCVNVYNPNQKDGDADGVGDVCDTCPRDYNPCQDTILDICGVCLPPALFDVGASCRDCFGIPNGTAVFDACGVCDGDGTSCLPCETETRFRLSILTDDGVTTFPNTLFDPRPSAGPLVLEFGYNPLTCSSTGPLANAMALRAIMDNLNMVVAVVRNTSGAPFFAILANGAMNDADQTQFDIQYLGMTAPPDAGQVPAFDDTNPACAPVNASMVDTVSYNSLTTAYQANWHWKVTDTDGGIVGPLAEHNNACLFVSVDACDGESGILTWNSNLGLFETIATFSERSSFQICTACQADRDCAGVPGGSAFANATSCGVCVGGTTGLNVSDIRDGCGDCPHGEETRDCNGDCHGTAFLDQCDVCSGGLTNHTANSDQDCHSVCFGTAVVDECGVCGGMNRTCNNCTGTDERLLRAGTLHCPPSASPCPSALVKPLPVDIGMIINLIINTDPQTNATDPLYTYTSSLSMFVVYLIDTNTGNTHLALAFRDVSSNYIAPILAGIMRLRGNPVPFTPGVMVLEATSPTNSIWQISWNPLTGKGSFQLDESAHTIDAILMGPVELDTCLDIFLTTLPAHQFVLIGGDPVTGLTTAITLPLFDTSSSVIPINNTEPALDLCVSCTCPFFDACGVCQGDDSSCAGCDGIPFSGKVFDACGLCLSVQDPSFNTSCLGCDGVPASGFTFDSCGQCLAADDASRNSSCAPCNDNILVATWTDPVSHESKSIRLHVYPLGTNVVTWYGWNNLNDLSADEHNPELQINHGLHYAIVQDNVGGAYLTILADMSAAREGYVSDPYSSDDDRALFIALTGSAGGYGIQLTVKDDPTDTLLWNSALGTGSFFWAWPDDTTAGAVMGPWPLVDGVCLTLDVRFADDLGLGLTLNALDNRLPGGTGADNTTYLLPTITTVTICTSCSDHLDCFGVGGGDGRYDVCGVCRHPNDEAAGTTCLDCHGVVNGTAVVDACGVCGGNNSTCKDCHGIVNGPAVVDACGICGGDNSTCEPCDTPGFVRGLSLKWYNTPGFAVPPKTIFPFLVPDARAAFGYNTTIPLSSNTGFAQANQQVIVPYLQADGVLAIALVNSAPGADTGGSLDMAITFLGPHDSVAANAGLMVADDPPGVDYDYYSVMDHNTSRTTFAEWRWGKCCTDGGLFGPLPQGNCVRLRYARCPWLRSLIFVSNQTLNCSSNGNCTTRTILSSTPIFENLHVDDDPILYDAADPTTEIVSSISSEFGFDPMGSDDTEDSYLEICSVCTCPCFDACGVCRGNGSTCAGCDGVPNSHRVLDACGVCGGDSSTCFGCDLVPNSGLTFDICGVCGGDGSSCIDCAGVVNGPNRLDACGICRNPQDPFINQSCAGCDGVANSGAVDDICGVCNGNGSSCLGCDGCPNSGLEFDECGVCGGDGSTCIICPDPAEQVIFTAHWKDCDDPYNVELAPLHSRRLTPEDMYNYTDNSGLLPPFSYGGGFPLNNPGAVTLAMVRDGFGRLYLEIVYGLPEFPVTTGMAAYDLDSVNIATRGVDLQVRDDPNDVDPRDMYRWHPGTGLGRVRQEWGTAPFNDETDGLSLGPIPFEGCIDIRWNALVGIDTILLATQLPDGTVGFNEVPFLHMGTYLELCSCCGCPSRDLCGICGGNNTECTDCRGIPVSNFSDNVRFEPDDCGVCLSLDDVNRGRSCEGCDGVPNSGASLDVCGVCRLPNDTLRNTTCVDCAGVPYGNHRVDACGQCLLINNCFFNEGCSGCDGSAGSGKVLDACGVCGGNSSTCSDCLGVPNGHAVIDVCGVCNGQGTSCGGCDGVPASGKVLDVCGVCGGNGSTCAGCDGVPNSHFTVDPCGVCLAETDPTRGQTCAGCDGVPNSNKTLDACGICGGNNSTCLGCDGVPNSGFLLDACGNCHAPDAPANFSCEGCNGVPGSGFVLDPCGVCLSPIIQTPNGPVANPAFGQSCAGCDGFPNSGARIDACGVCGGDGSTCAGCDGVPNSGKILDACGVCLSPTGIFAFLFNSSCKGCDGVPNSGKELDACGVCGGFGQTCAGCDGVPNSNKTIDVCGICGGNGHGCEDCAGVPAGGHIFDVCGDCKLPNDPTFGQPCLGCDGHPFSGLEIDECGVCGGDGNSCRQCSKFTSFFAVQTGDEEHSGTSSYSTTIVNPADFHVTALDILDGTDLTTLNVYDPPGPNPPVDLSPVPGVSVFFAKTTGTNELFLVIVTHFGDSGGDMALYLNSDHLANSSAALIVPAGSNNPSEGYYSYTGDSFRYTNATGQGQFHLTSYGASIVTFALGPLPNDRLLCIRLTFPIPNAFGLAINPLGLPTMTFYTENHVTRQLANTSISLEGEETNEITVSFCRRCACPSFDPCGLCALPNSPMWGDNCRGCDGVPNSGKVLDECGVCAGNDSTCLDCMGVPLGNAFPDACGVCGGDGSTCAGCDGVPNSNKTFDACNVCGGDGTTCLGCDDIPFSGKVCDVCGVCGGNGSTCLGCDGIANSGKVMDACGVCGGSNSTCAGCDFVMGSGKTKDICGLCGGNGTSCLGCDGKPYSNATYNLCGVCISPHHGRPSRFNEDDRDNEEEEDPLACLRPCEHHGQPVRNRDDWEDEDRDDNDDNDDEDRDRDDSDDDDEDREPKPACLGCDGVENSGVRFDACGVCGGDNSTCKGCDGVPFSGARVDVCGRCLLPKDPRFNTTCLGCDHVPFSNKTLDACGVCGGNNSTCRGCNNVTNSHVVFDACCTCGGNGSQCTGCDGVFGSGKQLDACGICGGNGQSCLPCQGPNSLVQRDACGVCGGDNSTCTDCSGVVNGHKSLDHCGRCLLKYTWDDQGEKRRNPEWDAPCDEHDHDHNGDHNEEEEDENHSVAIAVGVAIGILICCCVFVMINRRRRAATRTAAVAGKPYAYQRVPQK